MALGIQLYRSLARRATVFSAKLYDQVDSNAVVAAIAQSVPSVGRQKIQSVHWASVFARMREWVGARALQEIFADALEIRLRPFEITFELDRLDMELNGDSAILGTVQQMGEHFSNGWATGRADHAYAPLRLNALTYDGQNMFDTGHLHPDGATFSNIIDLSDAGISRSSTGAPTKVEAARELDYAIQRLQLNRLRRASITMTPERAQLAVVAKNDGVHRGYLSLRDDAQLENGVDNPWRGKFSLMRDWQPVSGDEKKVDVILAEPNGPRPSILVEQRRPGAVEVDESTAFRDRKVMFGQDGIMGFDAGFPQPAVRIEE